MQHIDNFSEIEEEFLQRVRSMVYCSAATIDLHQRPRVHVSSTESGNTRLAG